MSRWVTFYYDQINERVLSLIIHDNREDALKYFNRHCGEYFELNTRFKADKLPASYGYAVRRYYGISATAFKKMFEISVDEALSIARGGKNNEQ